MGGDFLINHFDLFGLRQVYLHLRDGKYTHLKFGTPWLYKFVRHPLSVGWFLAFWATPTMTVTHLVFAIATTAYVLIAIQLEERDLMKVQPEYAEYREQVPISTLPLSYEPAECNSGQTSNDAKGTTIYGSQFDSLPYTS